MPKNCLPHHITPSAATRKNGSMLYADQQFVTVVAELETQQTRQRFSNLPLSSVGELT